MEGHSVLTTAAEALTQVSTTRAPNVNSASHSRFAKTFSSDRKCFAIGLYELPLYDMDALTSNDPVKEEKLECP
jgi:hypothetical protein